MRQVAVIGGGAAGMTAAITAAREHDHVILLEHTAQLGKKILYTGNGRCNLTNRRQAPDCYRCAEPVFVKEALEQFGFDETLDFFRERGLFFKERDGYFYPRSLQASAVRDCLLGGLAEYGVDVRTGFRTSSIIKEDGRFLVAGRETSFSADSVILACGGMAAPATGSDGSGYGLALRLGHRLVEPVPALTGLRTRGTSLKKASGVRTACRVSLYIKKGGQRILAAEDTGELQITDYGVSGIPVFQVSRYASRALADGDESWIVLDFLPEYGEEEGDRMLEALLSGERADRPCQEILCGLFPDKLAAALLKAVKVPSHLPAESLTEKQRAYLKRAVRAFSMTVAEVNPFSQSQTTAGGIDVRDVNGATMESKLVPGLFFAGEILDVDGICGGYNLQWAWTSGWLAGKQGRL